MGDNIFYWICVAAFTLVAIQFAVSFKRGFLSARQPKVKEPEYTERQLEALSDANIYGLGGDPKTEPFSSNKSDIMYDFMNPHESENN